MIGILETGRPPARLRPEWGSYGAMMRAMLGPRAYRSYDVARGALPADPAACSAYVVTGSSAGVYEDRAWIAPLLDFLRQSRGKARLVGVCFGHQAIAQAFGGQVEKSAHGWGLGLGHYAAAADGLPPEIAVAAFHQDQVVSLPPDAVVLASSAHTPYAALAYGGDAQTIQPHPEFTPGFSAALLVAERDRYGTLTDPALRSLDAPNDNACVGAWLGRFIDGSDAAPG